MKVFTSIYILILAYIIAALVFWEMRLQTQNGRIYAQEVITLRTQVDSLKYPEVYAGELKGLQEKLHSRTTQFVAEGTTFLIVILIGAAVVYGSFARRIRLSRQQNNFMLAVTHELKTPVAAIKLNLQTLEKHRLDEDKRNLLIARSIRESNRLDDLCNNMLFASRIEGGQYKASMEAFSLSQLIEDLTEEFAERSSRIIGEDIAPGCRIVGDRNMLRIAISNLLENAVKYTPGNKPVTITLEVQHTNATILVIDEGPGIPDAEKKKIFDKFYRIGSEESRKSKGTGLGLYLCSKIVAQHKGKIVVTDNKPTGSVFEVHLPLFRAS